MTPALLLVRDCIIYSVNVWLVPVEFAFDMIESELVRRGIDLDAIQLGTMRAARDTSQGGNAARGMGS
jgi:hypothetical protein